jgi:hypothetical protein
MRILLYVSIINSLTSTQALLPPKYRETLLCQPKYCLARRESPLFGSKKSQYICKVFLPQPRWKAYLATPIPDQDELEPLIWTTRNGKGILETLKRSGFHEFPCNYFLHTSTHGMNIM